VTKYVKSFSNKNLLLPHQSLRFDLIVIGIIKHIINIHTANYVKRETLVLSPLNSFQIDTIFYHLPQGTAK